MEKKKLVSLFSGIGAFESALSKFGNCYNLEMMAEVDIYASLSYTAIHQPLWRDVPVKTEEEMRKHLIDKNIGKDFKTGKNPVARMKGQKLEQLYKCAIATNNEGDVSLVDFTKYKDVDLVVGGSPCQDFSVAGKQQGSIWICNECKHEYNPLEQHYDKRDRCPKCDGINLNKTRSSLLVEYLRAIRELKPKYFIYENVKNIKGKEFIKVFNLFEKELKEYGYNTYNQVLNAKDYEVPQNRERVFVVGIREDIIQEYTFPEKMELKLRLKDLLEVEVDDKYYLSEEIQKRFKENLEIAKINNDIKYNKINKIGKIDIKGKESIKIVYNINGTSPCLDTMQGGNRQPKVLQNVDYRIRKLTPKECWRLMGFTDQEFNKAKEIGTSDSQLYKQAGNSIVVNVLYHIFKNLFIHNNIIKSRF